MNRSRKHKRPPSETLSEMASAAWKWSKRMMGYKTEDTPVSSAVVKDAAETSPEESKRSGSVVPAGEQSVDFLVAPAEEQSVDFLVAPAEEQSVDFLVAPAGKQSDDFLMAPAEEQGVNFPLAPTGEQSVDFPDGHEGGMMKPVELPQSVVDFYNRMKTIKLLETDRIRVEDYASDVQKIIKYTGTALENGRPLNKVMIIMAGQSGAGKSTTINSLFNDQICKTSSSTSETREVTEYGTQLCVTVEAPPIKGFLSFVDIPGSLDVEHSKESMNLATITEFRKKHGDLADRTGFFESFWKIKQHVYPNLVLMIVKSGDNRMVGTNSSLKKSLSVLDHCRLVDRIRKNLIVVVTHAMSLSTMPEPYKKKCNENIDHIRKAVHDVLGICEVKIVFVENIPSDFGMKKGKKSDFYILPDGQLSHYNLIQAMVEHFKHHDDYLGRLLCGWYFADNCPEKNNKPQVLQSVDHAIVTDETVNEAKKILGCLKIGLEEATEEEVEFPPFPFQYLGRGYCPITESIKNVNVYSGNVTKSATILGKKYTIPKCVQVVPKSEHYYHRLSCETRDMYEKSRIGSYGLEADVKLVVNVDSRGRWVKGNAATNNRSVVSILDEIRQANVRMDEPESNMKDKLAKAIAKLPTKFNTETANSFSEFLCEWGSHFICEVWVGGCIKVDYSVKASTFTDEIGGKLMNQVKSTIRGVKGHVEADASNKSSKKENTEDEQLTISGGEPPHATSLEELAPEMKEWLASIKAAPTELQHSFKLSPYYILAEGECKTSLRNATIAYLGGTMTEKVNTTRDDVSKKIVSLVVEEKVKKNCFPPCATVSTKDGVVAFKYLLPGANVLTVNSAATLGLDSKPSLTEMFSYIHYDPELVANYFVFHLENGRSLTVTGDHLVFSYDNGTVKAVRAKRLKIDDYLICVLETCSFSQNVKPVRIAEISQATIKGVYSPLTYDGKLIVDGNLVSCYANIDSHTIAHASMEPLRWWYVMRSAVRVSLSYINGSFWRDTRKSSTSLSHAEFMDQPSSGIHEYAKFLMSLRNILPFETVQD